MESRVLDVMSDRRMELGPHAASAVTQVGSWKHFRLARDTDGVAWLLFDRAGASANTLSAEVLEELDNVINVVESDRPAALVIRSAKPSGFIAGADVNEFRGATDPQQVETAMARAHAVTDRIENLGFPTIAVIHGFCLGGGPLPEIALVCKYRIAIRRRPLRLPGGHARPASRPWRHRTVHPADQPARSDDADADRPHHRRAPRQIAWCRRCRDAGTSCRCGGRRTPCAASSTAPSPVHSPA